MERVHGLEELANALNVDPQRILDLAHDNALFAAVETWLKSRVDEAPYYRLKESMELAIEAYMLASGTVIVPRDPTEEMKTRGCDYGYSGDEFYEHHAENVYYEMLYAAPNPFPSHKQNG